MRKVSGRLRLDLAQFRELEAFAAFASDLDKASRAQLERGARLVELLKQPQYSPYSVAGAGRLDLGRHRGQARRHPGRRGPPLRVRVPAVPAARARATSGTAIADGQAGDDDSREPADAAIAEFKQLFLGRADDAPRQRGAGRAAGGRRDRETVTRDVRHARTEGLAMAARYRFFVGGSARSSRRRRSPRRGARRDQPHRQGPGAGDGLPAVRGGDHRGAHGAGVATPRSTTRCCTAARAGAAGRRPADHQRPGPGRRLQRQRDPDRRAADRAAARGRQGGRRSTSSAARASATTGSATGRSRRAGPASPSSRPSPTPARSVRR